MKKRVLYILILLLAFGLVGCKTPVKKEAEIPKPPPEPTLTAVNIMNHAVEFKISGDFTYAVYKPSDPYTVAVDIPGVDAGMLAGKMPSERFRGNEAYLQFVIMAYHLFEWFKKNFCPRNGVTIRWRPFEK